MGRGPTVCHLCNRRNGQDIDGVSIINGRGNSAAAPMPRADLGKYIKWVIISKEEYEAVAHPPMETPATHAKEKVK